MTGKIGEIKGKLIAGWHSLFSGAPAPLFPGTTFSAHAIYYIFHPRGPVATGAINKTSILEGSRKIERLLVEHKNNESPSHTLFLMAFREFQGVIHDSENDTEFRLEDRLLIPLYDHSMVLGQTIDLLAARQQAIKGQGGVTALLGTSEIKSLQQDIKTLTHVNNRISTLFTPGDIAEKAQRQKRELQEEYANHSPFLPKEWRIG